MIRQIVKDIVRRLIHCLPFSLKKYIFSVLVTYPGFESASGFGSRIEPRTEPMIAEAIRSANTKQFEAAERLLREAATINPADHRVASHLSRVRFLQSRSMDPAIPAATGRTLAVLQAMNAEIERVPLYVPSKFWRTFGKFHVDLIEQYGIENFKRTVSHNYQNWFMTSLEDKQVRRLFETWSLHMRTEPWFNQIEIPDNVGLHPSCNFDTPEYPLADPYKREIYRISVGLLWEYVLEHDRFGALTDLEELEVGNPIRIWRHGRLISSDLAHSVRERNFLLNSLKIGPEAGVVVGELGAGHGRLAEVFGRTSNFRHFIFDITPALYVSQWYIERIFPSERIFHFRHFDRFSEIERELRGCRFAFFTPNQIELIPKDSLDLFINMNSLMEMRIEQIRNFLAQIDRITKTAFLSRQWFRWTNPVDGITVSKADFNMTSRWQLILDQVDEIFPDFFNQIWRKS